MAFKVNYGFERAERARAKQAKKDAKAAAKKAGLPEPEDAETPEIADDEPIKEPE